MKLSNTMKTIKLSGFNTIHNEVRNRVLPMNQFADTKPVTPRMIWGLIKAYVKGEKVNSYDAIHEYMDNNAMTSSDVLSTYKFAKEHVKVIQFVYSGDYTVGQLEEAVEFKDEWEDVTDTCMDYNLNTKYELEEIMEKAERNDEYSELIDVLDDNSITDADELSNIIDRGSEESAENIQDALSAIEDATDLMKQIVNDADETIKSLHRVSKPLEHSI